MIEGVHHIRCTAGAPRYGAPPSTQGGCHGGQTHLPCRWPSILPKSNRLGGRPSRSVESGQRSSSAKPQSMNQAASPPAVHGSSKEGRGPPDQPHHHPVRPSSVRRPGTNTPPRPTASNIQRAPRPVKAAAADSPAEPITPDSTPR
ncbi:hypothetical protein ACLOJK_004047, partial [Asimina triloba]